MNEIVQQAISSVNKSKNSFCKFISANDAGSTGAHQEGFYIPKNSIPLLFDTPGIKGENKDRFVTIKWQNDFETQSRFIYYGQGTRNEYRITRFGKGFPFLTDDNVGDLFILSHIEGDYYEGFVLSTDEDIEEFFVAFNLSSAETNRLIDKKSEVDPQDKILSCFVAFVESLKVDFPTTFDLSQNARKCYISSYGITNAILQKQPDKELLNWIDAEFKLFKTIENIRYDKRIKTPFDTVEELVNTANTILNRRKSRAGKSLEHHLAEMFNIFSLQYNSQGVTEDNKKPDFIFPSADAYQDPKFDDKKLIVLASKTTCKDRWRQILNEADRIKTKHLFTLQQGISQNQLEEMYKYNVCLVVPEGYLKSFPEIFRNRILTLEKFITNVKVTQ